ncbi:MAG: ribonuclease P protein component [Acidobacteriota bacterium]|nr:ribonuclease P protein component [Acidobacteriota bacterium]
MSRTLTRRERLRTRPEFLAVQRRGARSRGRYLTLLGLPNGLDVTRLGVVASRRLGKAFRRNRSKRLIRELFRLNKRRSGFDLVVLPRPELCDAAFDALQADYRNALRRFERSHG